MVFESHAVGVDDDLRLRAAVTHHCPGRADQLTRVATNILGFGPEPPPPPPAGRCKSKPLRLGIEH